MGTREVEKKSRGVTGQSAGHMSVSSSRPRFLYRNRQLQMSVDRCETACSVEGELVAELRDLWSCLLSEDILVSRRTD
jgi:hypothetical protein